MSSKSSSAIVRPNELCEELGVSRATLWRWSRKGLLPPKRQIGPNVAGYLRAEIDEWLASRPQIEKPGAVDAQSNAGTHIHSASQPR